LTFSLIEYVKRDDRQIALLSPQFWGALLRREGPINAEEFLVLRPEGSPQYLLAPIWANGHFYALTFVYEGTNTVNLYYCDSNWQPISQFERGIMKIYSLFKQMANIPEDVKLRIINYSRQSVYQDFSVDWLSCAARAAFNTVGLLDWLKLDDRNENNILNPNEKMDLIDFRTWLFARLMPLFGASDQQVEMEIERLKR
jgi:hypothetical protein